MRIATWNCKWRSAQQADALSGLTFDIAVIQRVKTWLAARSHSQVMGRELSLDGTNKNRDSESCPRWQEASAELDAGPLGTVPSVPGQ